MARKLASEHPVVVASVRLSFLVLASLLVASVPMVAAQGGAGSPALADPDPSSDRWVDATLSIAQPTFTRMEITASLAIRKYVVQGDAYSDADDISDAYLQMAKADGLARQNGQASNRADAFVADIEKSAADGMRDILLRSYPDSNVSVGAAIVDRTSFQAPDDRPFEPGVAIRVTASVDRQAKDLGLGDRSVADLEAILDVGAAIRTNVTLAPERGYDLTYQLAPATGTVFTSVEGATMSPDGRTAVVRVPQGASPAALRVSFRDTSAPTFDASDAAVNVTVDLKDVDVTVGQAIGGDFGNLLVDLTVTADLGVIEITDELRGALPEGVTLDFLSADGLRLLMERDVLTDADITKMETDLIKQVGEKLGRALGGTVPVEGGFDRETFAASLMTTPLSGKNPLVFQATAKVAKPLAGGPIQQQAAIALYTTELPLSFPRIEGLDTQYTVIAPKGLAITDVKGEGVTRGTSADGRDQFTVTPQGESQTITASLAVTPGFVMAKFWPLVLGLVLLLVLIVGTPIALVRMRKKNKAKAPDAPKK